MTTAETLSAAERAGQVSPPLVTGAPAQEPEKPPEISYELTVSEDNLKAHLYAPAEGNSPLNIEDLKKFLKAKGICHGLVDDRQIGELINQGSIFQKLCLIAEGQPATPGKDAQVTFCFDRDPLKIGSIKEGGGIDYKDKGEIPQVKEGDLLSEKIPLVKEKPGMDVFGKPVPVDAAKDIPFVTGTGTKKSEDGLKIYAQTSGRPELLSDGRLCVLAELKIPGDVNLGVGHVRFEGFVDVAGTIQEGFQVKAGRLAAMEIHRAEVQVEGDIVVNGGIIGAKIFCKGNLKTRFIQSSSIEAWGDVLVEREVIDSKIETHGAFIAKPAGKIFSSRITATKGIVATQIGSDYSKPCFLAVGLDSQTKNRIKKMEEEISAKEEEKKKINASIEVLNQASWRLKEDIIKWVQIQDRAAIEQRSYKKVIAEAKEKNDSARLAQASRELEKIEEKIRSAEEPLQKLMDKEDQCTEKTTALQLQSKELDCSIQGLRAEVEKIMKELQKKVTPTIRILGQVFPATILEGCHSSRALKECFEDVLIKETQVFRKTSDGAGSSFWEMQISAPT